MLSNPLDTEPGAVLDRSCHNIDRLPDKAFKVQLSEVQGYRLEDRITKLINIVSDIALSPDQMERVFRIIGKLSTCPDEITGEATLELLGKLADQGFQVEADRIFDIARNLQPNTKSYMDFFDLVPLIDSQKNLLVTSEHIDILLRMLDDDMRDMDECYLEEISKYSVMVENLKDPASIIGHLIEGIIIYRDDHEIVNFCSEAISKLSEKYEIKLGTENFKILENYASHTGIWASEDPDFANSHANLKAALARVKE